MSQCAETFPSTTGKFLNNTYVDYVQSGGDHRDELVTFKEEATRSMEEGVFHLYKWHSNLLEVRGALETQRKNMYP